MNYKITSEIGPLRFVVTHKPGYEHSFITPSHLIEKIEKNNKILDNPDYLLFDDIIQIKKAQDEHNQLYKILHYFTDGNSYEFTDMLTYLLDDKIIRKNLIKECANLEIKKYENEIDENKLFNINSNLLVKVLLSGYLNDKKIFTHPIPNLIFTRDIAVCVGHTILITWSKKDVRKRENILSKFVFSNFKEFKDMKIYDFHEKHPNLSIEGGDILIFDKKRVCIGISERTPIDSIEKLTKLFFDEEFETVYAIDIPKRRALMHLDTIFTRISENEVLVYPPMLDNKISNKIYIYKNNSKPTISKDNLINVLKKDGLKLTVINCGGNSDIMQKREQWTDGANSFALDSGKIISYDCNEFTLKELNKSGYEIISSQDYLKDYKNFNNSNKKFAITLKCSELVRGRGGPRCLTMPIFRI